MQTNEITLRQQFIERNELDPALARFIAWRDIIAEQAHIKASSALSHGHADASTANDSQGFAKDIVAPNRFPFALDHSHMSEVNASSQRQQ